MAERSTSCDAQLRAHEIDARHLFRYRVLDLQARVRFDEDERALAAGACVQKKFKRPEASKSGCVSQARSGSVHVLAERVGETRSRRNLDQFLIAALERALAFEEVRDVTRTVTDDLHFDVARIRNQQFDVEVWVAESRRRLGTRPRVRFFEVLDPAHDAHPAAAAAGNGFEHHGRIVAEGLKEVAHLVEARRAECSVRYGDVVLHREFPGTAFVAEEFERVGRRSDKGDAGRLARMREIRVFAQETVARVDRVALGVARDVQDLRAVEIGGGAGSGERAGFIAAPDVQ